MATEEGTCFPLPPHATTTSTKLFKANLIRHCTDQLREKMTKSPYLPDSLDDLETSKINKIATEAAKAIFLGKTPLNDGENNSVSPNQLPLKIYMTRQWLFDLISNPKTFGASLNKRNYTFSHRVPVIFATLKTNQHISSETLSKNKDLQKWGLSAAERLLEVIHSSKKRKSKILKAKIIKSKKKMKQKVVKSVPSVEKDAEIKDYQNQKEFMFILDELADKYGGDMEIDFNLDNLLNTPINFSETTGFF